MKIHLTTELATVYQHCWDFKSNFMICLYSSKVELLGIWAGKVMERSESNVLSPYTQPLQRRTWARHCQTHWWLVQRWDYNRYFTGFYVCSFMAVDAAYSASVHLKNKSKEGKYVAEENITAGSWHTVTGKECMMWCFSCFTNEKKKVQKNETVI